MTYEKIIKNKIQNAFGGLFDTLSIEKKTNLCSNGMYANR